MASSKLSSASKWSAPVICMALVLCVVVRAADPAPPTVGLQPDGSILVPTNQLLRPNGTQVLFPGRPVDLALTGDGQVLVVKNMHDLVFIDIATGKIRQTLSLQPPEKSPLQQNLAQKALTQPISPTGKLSAPPPVGFSVVGLLIGPDQTIYASDSTDGVRIAVPQLGGAYRWGTTLKLSPPAVGGDAYPTGMALYEGDLWVCSSRGNEVQRIHPASGKVVDRIPVGVAPYGICFPSPTKCYVSNWGGDLPAPGAPWALSSGTPVQVDPNTGIANQGTVSLLTQEGGKWKKIKSIPVGLHPCGMCAGPLGRHVFVANANSDTVSVIDVQLDAVVETMECRPHERLPFGSGSNAVAISPNGAFLFVANGGNNCVAVFRLGALACELPSPVESRQLGVIPTGWYPGAVAISADGGQLYVANVKGVGALSQPRPESEGKNTHDWLGSVSLMDVPNPSQLSRLTAIVQANNRTAVTLAKITPPNPNLPPVPVPRKHGEPSIFQHVIYVIKENRSYDQIFGDMKEGNGDPSLVMFGEDVTPNQHALARQFTLFDNFYCSGSLSATGHQWTNEAYSGDYLEKAFGGFTRSYPVDGDDALAFAASGFLWDNALRLGRTFRNFGEFTSTTYSPANATWSDLYADFKNGTRKVKVDVKANVAPMAAHTHSGYPGFPLTTPDVYRAQIFIDELKECERSGVFPSLTYLFLPCDHTTGTRPGQPTPRAMLADNDLALGRVVEAVSKSRFWPRTCIFVVEDDPQFGMDHVDGHRTIAQVISPYTKRGFVDRANYNQTSMVKTIELILGLPPMNQLDLSAAAMRTCFQDKPDLAPFTALPNRVPLDEMNPPLDKLKGQARIWAEKSMKLDFEKEDEADEETLNRILWHAVKGDGVKYPRD